MADAVYDRIGRGYTATRRPDPRIAAAIAGALGDARTIVNVGAGAGAYEPPGRPLTAVEQSWRMLEQRPRGAARVVQAAAEALPFRSGAFDGALAVLTLHHWTDWRAGVAEMQRVARRVVIFTHEPGPAGSFWLTGTYFPELAALDRERFPSAADVADRLGDCRVERLPVPHDCVDGFLAAFWRRPEAYLDPGVRAGMSGFALLDRDAVARGVARLEADLASGEWERRFGHLRALDALDAGYRLLTAGTECSRSPR